ncbi:MAG: Type secretion system protein [Patescibacteria group bacterium]|nr:Type secretion system protein [Patescibacteria group bacterium]
MLARRQQAGDTIVEVLIVIIVIATVLASAYGISIRSLQATQLTQERAFALKLAEGQLESLKSAASLPDSTVLDNDQGFCLNGTTVTPISGGSPSNNYQTDQTANYPTECQQDPHDPVGKACTSYCYYVGIKKSIGGTGNNFVASVRWTSARGIREQVQLAYKVYQ